MSANSPRPVTRTFPYDGGRPVTVHLPPAPPGSLVYVADGGWHAARLAEALATAGHRSTVVVGVHGMPDDDGRLREYLPTADPDRFAAHEEFFTVDVRQWVEARFGLTVPPDRCAVWGASVGGEFALALGLRHRDHYGVVFSASPGGGYRPPTTLAAPLPRTYLVAGTDEPFFRDNATRWATALRTAGADVVLTERPGDHGDEFWIAEFPPMVAWAFGSHRADTDEHATGR